MDPYFNIQQMHYAQLLTYYRSSDIRSRQKILFSVCLDEQDEESAKSQCKAYDQHHHKVVEDCILPKKNKIVGDD
jgi:hypothetical protein